MKKLLLLLFIAVSLSSFAQKKDTTQPKLYYLILNEKQWQDVLTLIKSADEKPSVVTFYENLILANLKLIAPEPKQKKP